MGRKGRREDMLSFIKENQHIDRASLEKKIRKYFPKATDKEIRARINSYFLMKDFDKSVNIIFR